MIALDLPPPLWVPSRPAIVRPAEHTLLRPGFLRPATRAEARAMIADAVRSRRLTRDEAERALKFAYIHGPPAMIGAGAFTLTFNSSATANAATITIPAGALAGDLAVLFDCAYSTSPGAVTPAGWTNVANATVTSVTRGMTHYKVLLAGDPGSSVTGMDETTVDKVMLVFRPSRAIVSVVASTWNADATTLNPASQTVLAVGVATPLVVIGGAGAASSTAAFVTASPAFDATVTTADSDAIMGYKVYNSAPADHTIDMDDLGSGNNLHSGYLRVT